MIVGLTGGIGSGKTTVTKYFAELGIPIYIADEEAKKITETDPNVIEKIKMVFGDEAYVNGKYNRKYIADIVFKDKKKLNQLNTIIHPALFNHFNQWHQKQNTPYVIKEAAILFESGAYKDCDYIITVTAPEEIRIQRVIERDGITETMVKNRIDNQMSEEEKIQRADFRNQ